MARTSFWMLVFWGGLMGLALPLAERDGAAIAADPWEAEFTRWEDAEQKTPPPAEPILFVGSSSIRLWNLGESFPNLPVVNHGFGGSQVSDTLANLERIVLRYKPRTIVCYAGDNDIASGKSPAQVAKNVAQVVEKIHAELPQTCFVYIAIKPSLARWKLIDKVRSANAQIAAAMKDDPLSKFMSVEAEMLGTDGTPRPELFVADGLHLNADGYRLWTKLLLPEINSRRSNVQGGRHTPCAVCRLCDTRCFRQRRLQHTVCACNFAVAQPLPGGNSGCVAISTLGVGK